MQTAAARRSSRAAATRKRLGIKGPTGEQLDLQAFVPAKDFALAKQFYVDLGFKLNWGNDEMGQFEIGSFRFLLQKFYVKEHTENFMMHLMVDDADLWWKHIETSGLVLKYPGMTAKAPAQQPWGLRVLYLSDPNGVLWHIADRRQPVLQSRN